MNQTEQEYEVLRWMKINPRGVLESEPAYIARAIADFTETKWVAGYNEGYADRKAEQHYD